MGKNVKGSRKVITATGTKTGIRPVVAREVGSKLLRLRVDQLSVHPVAQRSLNQSKLKKMMDTLDLDAIGVLHAVVYQINGVTKPWIIDGQHRYQALMNHGFGEWEVEVKIHTEAKDDARACELFLKLNDRASVHPFDKFRNALNAGVEDAVGVDRVVGQHGLKVHPVARSGHVVCISGLRRMYAIDAGETLSKTLDIATKSWGLTASAVEGKVLEGLGMVLIKYNGAINEAALIKKLSKYPGGCSALLGDARGIREYRRGSLAKCVAERIIEHYNVGRRIARLEVAEVV